MLHKMSLVLSCGQNKAVNRHIIMFGHYSALLSDEDLECIAKNTSISRSQIENQYENFLEKHPDGKITKQNFRNMMHACYPESDIAKLESHIFRMHDKIGDGHIDFREFFCFIPMKIIQNL